MKVLVVEDAPDMVDAIGLCLRIRWPDVIVLSTEQGLEATHLVEAEGPDIVIFDLGLPDVDGLKVLQEIRGFQTCR